ncbi:FkbM family methyltransferase [Halalkalicoccus jeotgali]|uniref:SAM-dependent methyltransferase n=1 Tax=Halalkalicoccus jeotgali (strain DSM 18796 / CECT 7217 / JCM 14584 / KCTC 4019 / B3) TaxID=795797 RepID=D8J479_HALJB|nr:FkbM family methyltransferase [Halalkalicoccus jeotgali]ADJ15471.1 SAM-dependent methyltransferase [Halalkalicoccus jeotgali B3]ELY36120.1 SAM-dependent methyltransferase [Halalkalicoccus jeotgali B3]
MILLDRLRRAVRNPSLIGRFAKTKISETALLARRRRLGALASYAVAGVTGWSPYDRYLRRLARTGRTSVCSIDGLEMALDLTDDGLSRELFLYGTREQTTVERFERELRALRGEIDGPIRVLEIGANIGYFALIEARALGPRAEIHAFEPDSRNLPLLRENLARNGYSDRIRIDPAAIGPTTGRAVLERSSHSNRNRLASDGGRNYAKALSLTGETRTVDVWSVDDYLDENGIDPDSIAVVRMDVEGYETEILRGMESVLAASGPLVLFVELHPHLLSDAEYREFVTALEAAGFEPCDVISESITARPFDGSLGVERIEDLLGIDRSGYKLVAKRPAAR